MAGVIFLPGPADIDDMGNSACGGFAVRKHFGNPDPVYGMGMVLPAEDKGDQFAGRIGDAEKLYGHIGGKRTCHVVISSLVRTSREPVAAALLYIELMFV